MFQKQDGFSEAATIILIIVGFIAAVIVIPLILALLGLITLPFLPFEAKVQLNQGVITKTYDTDYCLSI